jgi:hypothetical protein
MLIEHDVIVRLPPLNEDEDETFYKIPVYCGINHKNKIENIKRIAIEAFAKEFDNKDEEINKHIMNNLKIISIIIQPSSDREAVVDGSLITELDSKEERETYCNGRSLF